MTLSSRTRLLASALALALLAALLLLSSLTVVHEPPSKKLTVLQDVKFYVEPKPPPSPEPVKKSSNVGGSDALKVNIPQREAELGLMKLSSKASGNSSLPGDFGQGKGLIGKGFGDGNGDGLENLFGLNQLDSTPIVMSAPPMTYPDRLVRRNILTFRVMFHIAVDEDGHTHPVRIVQSPDDTLNDQFMQYAAQVIFSPPMHEGKRVRAEYLWPAVFEFKMPDKITDKRAGRFR
ncbi:MAG TPA: energy transducer TonB [Candidatus Acidoferrum sp.]|nr:energy transducer TonB [Candidatus Acidoferrum sp.]